MSVRSRFGLLGLCWTAACASETSPAGDQDATGSSGIDLTSSTTEATTLTSTDGSTSSTAADVDSGSEGSTSTETGTSSCGDEIVEGDEVCDGTDLAGGTCDSRGFGPGMLTCEADCTAYDTSGCAAPPGCGDAIIDATEDCEGSELGGATCMSEGFDSGTLACGRDCLYDTTGCGSCGNMTADGDEDCDDVDLGVGTCVDEGFAAGTLACAVDCTYDTTMCTLCGNGMVDVGESCDAPDLGGAACGSVGMGFTGGTLGCSASCAFDTAGCTSFAAPAQGELVITEVMKDPTTVPDSTGEWIEIHNPGAVTYQLLDCAIQGVAMAEQFTIDVDLTIGPGEYVTFAADSMAGPGFVPSFSWSPANVFALANTTDTVRLQCGNTTVDEIAFDDNVLWPDAAGAAMQLDPDFFDAIDNGNGTWWCDASSDYNGDTGTPGSANTQCATLGVPFDAYFSEYVEGNGNNKGLEIYNAEAFSIDLGAENCFIHLYTNGAMTPTQQLALSGTLAAGDTLVVCNTQAAPAMQALCDVLTVTAMNYTGNDTLALRCQDELRDVIGQVGFDPGVSWGVAPDITVNATLRRDCNVTTGDANGADAFDPGPQWIGFGVDTFDDLGAHDCP